MNGRASRSCGAGRCVDLLFGAPMIVHPTLELAEVSQVTWDALVVGAGPAGALAAHQLAAAGRHVLLVDRQAFPRPKVCGACVNLRALDALRAAGLDHVAAGLGGLPL